MKKDREQLVSRVTERMKQMRMIDMHAHLSFDGERAEQEKELEFRKNQGIYTCFSTGTPVEWEQFQPWRERKEILVSFGLHPWYADQFDLEECEGLFRECDFIGEIGMDSVWCQVPLKLQQRVLEGQLQAAADLGKPVILHTKGQEKRIGEIIRDFPGKICVHWYSGTEKDLEGYLEKDCYFTLGPDTADTCGCMRILKEVSPDRLFVETDGLSAVAWARKAETLEIEEIPAVLWKNTEYAAKAKGYSAREMELCMKKNLAEFLNETGEEPEGRRPEREDMAGHEEK